MRSENLQESFLSVNEQRASDRQLFPPFGVQNLQTTRAGSHLDDKRPRRKSTYLPRHYPRQILNTAVMTSDMLMNPSVNAALYASLSMLGAASFHKRNVCSTCQRDTYHVWISW